MSTYHELFKEMEKKEPVITKESEIEVPEISLEIEEHQTPDSAPLLTCARIILDYVRKKIPSPIINFGFETKEQKLAYILLTALTQTSLENNYLNEKVERAAIKDDRIKLAGQLSKNNVQEAINLLINYIKQLGELKDLDSKERMIEIFNLLFSIILEKEVRDYEVKELDTIRKTLKKIKESKPGRFFGRDLEKEDLIGLIKIPKTSCYMVKGLKGKKIILYSPITKNKIEKECEKQQLIVFKIGDRIPKKDMLSKIKREVSDYNLELKRKTDNLVQIIESLSKIERMKKLKRPVKKVTTKMSDEIAKEFMRLDEVPDSFKVVFKAYLRFNKKNLEDVLGKKGEIKDEIKDQEVKNKVYVLLEQLENARDSEKRLKIELLEKIATSLAAYLVKKKEE